MSRGLQERIAAKLAGSGLDDLLAMLQGIRSQDTAGLSAEADALAAHLLARARESLDAQDSTKGHALARAARQIQPGAEPESIAL